MGCVVWIIFCLFFSQQLKTEDKTEEISSDVLEILSFRIHKMYTLWFEILGADSIMVTDYINFGSKNVSKIKILQIYCMWWIDFLFSVTYLNLNA